MPDLRDKRQAKLRARKQKHRGPGDNNVLPNNNDLDRDRLPDDVARDVSNEGVMDDPKRHEQRLNP